MILYFAYSADSDIPWKDFCLNGFELSQCKESDAELGAGADRNWTKTLGSPQQYFFT